MERSGVEWSAVEWSGVSESVMSDVLDGMLDDIEDVCASDDIEDVCASECVCDVCVREDWEDRREKEEGAGTALKTKAPHVNVGNKRRASGS